MNESPNQIELLLENAVEYGKTSFQLLKLKALDKSSDIVSSVVPLAFVIVLLTLFLFFGSIGIAFWLGEIFNKVYLGFMVVAFFYGVLGIVIHFFLQKWIKKLICNYIIKLILN